LRLISLWQDIEFDEEEKGLHPCCFETMWTVDGEYLDMTLIQRSGDLLGAAIGVNEIQYAGLLVMVAWECGYKPRKFTHFIQNLHVYDRHIDICKELCNRESIECNPMLVIDTDKTSIFDLTIDDFKMIDYPLNDVKVKNPQVKFPLAI
jgi:thymidylate synthase